MQEVTEDDSGEMHGGFLGLGECAKGFDGV